MILVYSPRVAASQLLVIMTYSKWTLKEDQFQTLAAALMDSLLLSFLSFRSQIMHYLWLAFRAIVICSVVIWPVVICSVVICSVVPECQRYCVAFCRFLKSYSDRKLRDKESSLPPFSLSLLSHLFPLNLESSLR